MQKQSDKKVIRLKRDGVDTLMLIEHGYGKNIPGGKFKFQEDKFIFHVLWKQNGKAYIQDFTSCKPVPLRIIRQSALDTLISFYQKQKINTLLIPSRVKSIEMQGYAFTVQIHGMNTSYCVRASERILLEEEATSSLKPDARLEWLKLVEQVVQVVNE